MKLSMLFFGLALLATSYSAEARDGKELLAECSVLLDVVDGKSPPEGDVIKQSYGSGFCTGFMQGILYTSSVYERRKGTGVDPVCVPDGLTHSRAARVVVDYLKEHPEILDMDANLLAIDALHSEFSCSRAGIKQ